MSKKALLKDLHAPVTLEMSIFVSSASQLKVWFINTIISQVFLIACETFLHIYFLSFKHDPNYPSILTHVHLTFAQHCRIISRIKERETLKDSHNLKTVIPALCSCVIITPLVPGVEPVTCSSWKTGWSASLHLAFHLLRFWVGGAVVRVRPPCGN